MPGGGFIQKPGSELNPFTDEPQVANEDFESPEVSMLGTFSSTSRVTSRFFGMRDCFFEGRDPRFKAKRGRDLRSKICSGQTRDAENNNRIARKFGSGRTLSPFLVKSLLGGRGGSSQKDPEIRAAGLKIVFSTLWASVWSTNKGEQGPLGPFPGSATDHGPRVVPAFLYSF